MKPRHAARELALLTLFQLAGKADDEKGLSLSIEILDSVNLRQMTQLALESLEDEAKEALKNAVVEWQRASEFILNEENEAPENLARPIELENLPVTMPTSQQMLNTLDQCLKAAEWVYEAIRIPKFIAWSRSEAVQVFSKRLVKAVCQHQPELDALLNEHLEDWRVERLAKMDRMILRMAVAEMKYFQDIDLGVSINEAVELAKRFSTLDSFKLINGVLGKLALVFESKIAIPSNETQQLDDAAASELEQLAGGGSLLAEGLSGV